MSADDVFLDSNVLLYILADDPPKTARAEALLGAGAVISVQVLNEFTNVAMRKSRLPLGEIRKILTTIGLLCRVVPLTLETHERGLDIAERHRISIYDAMIVSAALRAGCRMLLTEDLNHGQAIEGLAIRNPFAAPDAPA